MAFLIGGANSAADTAFDVANSCRFDKAGTAYMIKESANTANQKTGTISVWVKRGIISADMQIIGQTETNYTRLMFRSSDKLRFYSNQHDLETNRLFRDPAAWYHIMVTWDTTQGTAANRVKMYVNGVQETSFATESYPDEDDLMQFFIDTKDLDIARNVAGSDDYFDGYMAEFVVLEGTAAAATDFGEFNSDSPTIWQPINHSQSGNKGANGFYLDFEDSANLGNDKYGGTDFTETNLAAADQAVDSPTNNFATINSENNYVPGHTLSEGNCYIVTSTSSAPTSYPQPVTSTIGASSGKWYMEIKYVSTAQHNYGMPGITSAQHYAANSHKLGGLAGSYSIALSDGTSISDGGSNQAYFGGGITAGDIIGIYMDLDNNKLYFSDNGTLGSTTGLSITASASTSLGNYFFGLGDESRNTASFACNFGGCPASTISSGNTDDNGYGNFEYSPNITGDGSAKKFYALCTKNLAEFG